MKKFILLLSLLLASCSSTIVENENKVTSITEGQYGYKYAVAITTKFHEGAYDKAGTVYNTIFFTNREDIKVGDILTFQRPN